MKIWNSDKTVLDLLNRSKNTMVQNIGIEFIEMGDDYLIARMPVDERTRQPDGILHGGASAALAETLGSVASRLCLDDPSKISVGLELNANHIRPVKEGYVYGTVRPVNIGRKIHIWDIRITNEENKLVCVSRLTLSVIDA